MKYQGILIGIVISLVFGAIPALQAQNWDYEKYPLLDAKIEHLDAEIRILQEGIIEGDILYNISFRADDVDSLIFDASGINIGGVYIGDESVEYRMNRDRLVILLNESYQMSETANLRIQYQAEPSFGIHVSQYGTIWTSSLPRSVRHWLPVQDHPRVEFTTEFVFTHPSGMEMIANGRKGDSEVVSVEEEVTTFISNRPVPASALSWAVGELSQVATTLNMQGGSPGLEASAGIFQRRSDPQIYIYSETEQDNNTELLETAALSFQKIQEELGVRFPYRDLHIVVLEDDKWETKHYGAGTIFLYRNRGSIDLQIQNGVLSQWLGTQIREIQWADADAVIMLKAFLANKLFERDLKAERSEEPYHVYSDSYLARWQSFLNSPEGGSVGKILERVKSGLNTGNSKVLGWNELALLIYEHTGRPFFEKINPGYLPEEDSEETETLFEYTARMEWDEDERVVQIHFEAIGSSIDELVTVEVKEIGFMDDKEHELTFTGSSDTIILNVSANLENIKLHVIDYEHVRLSEEKPFYFWIYQLRNDDDAERRRDAASALSRFDDNPDLQLALNDLLRTESNPGVYAEIVRSIAAITRGASGTDQMFLDRTSTQQHEDVQKAAVEALAYYTGNERVIGRLGTLIGQTENTEIRRAAIRSLNEVSDADEFRRTVENLITRESVLYDIPFILNLLAEKGEEEAAVEFAEPFISGQFPFEVREPVFDLVLSIDRSVSGWADRLSDLISDRDPRIRKKAIGGLENLSSSGRRELIENRLADEYDERVRRELERL